MPQIFIFNFHRVSNEYSPAFPPIPIKTFERVVRFLNRQFVIIPQEALLEKLPITTKKDFCIITFDDGYADFAEYALPILEEYKIPIVLHIVTDVATTGKMFWTQRLNKIVETYYQLETPIECSSLSRTYTMKNDKEVEMTALDIYLRLLEDANRMEIINELASKINATVPETKMLTWQDLKSLPKNIVTIGSHTHTHNNLRKMSSVEISNELSESFNLIKENIGIEPLSIAYPNGQYNEEINAMASNVGYKLFYTCDGCKNALTQRRLFHRANLYNRQLWKNILKIELWKFR